ncbi:MAG: glycosyltransferase family 4 protein [Candidatus Merdivicinus sp.]|jgi:glycosyltransferase involved in cell wall biosynthesis
MEKHILILTTTNDFVGKFERENVRILQQMGYVVHYATNIYEPNYISDLERLHKMNVMVHPIEIARSPFLIRNNQKALRQLLTLMKKYPIQAIHCHTPVGGLLGRLTGRLCPERSPVILYTAHGFHFYQGAPFINRLFYYQAEKKLAHYTDILIVINQEDYRNARNFRLKKNGTLYQLPGVGLDLEIFKPIPLEERNTLRKQLGLGEEIFFLLSIGELNENKNHRVILQALAKLKHIHKDISSIHYGICGDGFFRQRMEQWISEMGLEDNVTLYGHRTDIPQMLGCADATAFPSKREGLGMAALESLAMGIPVIASDNRGTREYMKQGKNGFICRYDDVDEFAESIETIRNLDPINREKMKAYCTASARPFDKKYTGFLMRRIYADMEQRIEEKQDEKQTKTRNQYHNGSI